MSDKETFINIIILARLHCKGTLSAGLFDALEYMVPRALKGLTLDFLLDEMLNEDIQESGDGHLYQRGDNP